MDNINFIDVLVLIIFAFGVFFFGMAAQKLLSNKSDGNKKS